MDNWAALKEKEHELPVAKRARYGIHFDKGGGEILAEFVGKPCHYLDGGLWRPIDTALLATADGGYSSPHSDVVIHPDGRVKVRNSDYQQFTELPSAKAGKLVGDTLSAVLTNIGDLTNYSKLWFTVKEDESDADAKSIIQIEKTAGLLYINGAAATIPANGSITINDEPTGDVTVMLAAVELAKLSPGQYRYDIQILRSTGIAVSTLTNGTFIISADYTRAVA